jgi:N-succinyldiaminopimelate aminotransferase
MADDPGATTIFTVMTALAEETGAVNLGQGFPDEDGPSSIVEAAVDALRSGTKNQYAPLPGVPPLTEAVAEHQRRWYGVELDPATQVQVTFGATEGLASALLAVVRPGDEVLALDPMYDAYAPVTRMAGGVVKPLFLEPPDWRVTAEALAAAVSDRTRVLLLNSPHNPTGRVFDDEELHLLAELCRERDLVAITDEVYEHLVYEGRHMPLSVLAGMAERTITVSSVGKTHALTGWKIGWATGPPELVARVRGVKQFLTFAGGTPLQHAAAVALGLPDDEVKGAADSLRAKRDRLSAGLREVGFDVFPTEGTYFLNADACPLGYDDASELCVSLPHGAGVVAIPVSAFSAAADGPLKPIVRFAFCKRDEVLDEGIARLKKWAASR